MVRALALLLLAALAPSALGQGLLRKTLATPGDSKPVQLYADDVTTWSDAGRQVFLLKGRVWIEQGVINIRAKDAAVWVDVAGKKESGIYNIDVYGELVTLENGASTELGEQALLQLGTRGDIRIKSYANKTMQQATPNDPLHVRAMTLLRRLAPPPQQPSSPLADLVVKDGAAAPLPTSPVAVVSQSGMAPVGLPSAGSPSATANNPDIQLTQGLQTAPPVGAVPFPGPAAEAPAPLPDGPPSEPPPPLPPEQPIPSGLNPPATPRNANAKAKQINIRPRSSTDDISAKTYPLPTGETAWISNSGVILSVTDPTTNKVLLDIEADRICFWTKGDSQELFGNMRSPKGETTKSLEFYLSGHVEIRNQSKQDTEIIRADEVYYDVNRNVAIALRADLEIRRPLLPHPIHFQAEELQQLNAKLFLAKQTEVYSTTLPSDPGLKIQVREAQIEELDTVRKSIFGKVVIDRKTGQPIKYKQHIFSGDSNVIRLEGLPVMYFPRLRADVERPLGPLDGVTMHYNKIFGFQITTTWDLYQLLGIQRPDGHRWKLFVDGMTARGPGIGSEYDAKGKDLFGIDNKYEGLFKVYGMYDSGADILGGDRGRKIAIDPVTGVYQPITHPDWRGRIFGNINVQDLPDGFTVQGQVSALSDRNYLEQFYNYEFLTGQNQRTFLYAKQQNNIWAWTILAEGNLHHWLTHTDWLPKADGYVLGYKIFDTLTYNVHASAGFAELKPTDVVPYAYLPTDVRVNTGRFDLFQELSLPQVVGPFNIVPYVKLDLTEYTTDATGNETGRVYGGAGMRASVPFSRLYPDVESELFNVNGIFHKIVLSGNFYAAQSNTNLNDLPQLDRLNDDTSDQTLRDIRAWQPVFNKPNATFLTTSPLFDPQIYALRRLIDVSPDSLDSMEVLQLGLRQRLQTKRGYPGQEHVIDWMTLDVQASIFPRAQRDNFGSNFGNVNYDWVWNIGDRTALVSNGWFEMVDNGPRVFNFGTFISRPDRTNFYLGYRQIDPLQSKAVIASLTYAFSAKYALTVSSNYDFGTNVQSNGLLLTRMGTDLSVSFGLSFNSVVKTFGVQLEIVPNLIPANGRGPGSTFATTGGALGNR